MPPTAAAHYEIRTYHQTPEQYALQAAEAGGGAAQPEALTVAREQLALAVREHGEVIDLDSIQEVSRTPIVTDDAGDWRPADQPGDVPSGHIITWTCAAYQRVASDAGDPTVEVVDGKAEVPAGHRATGGAMRIRHDLGEDVTILAFNGEGEGMGYLLALTLEDGLSHVEFFAGTHHFTVTAD